MWCFFSHFWCVGVLWPSLRHHRLSREKTRRTTYWTLYIRVFWKQSKSSNFFTPPVTGTQLLIVYVSCFDLLHVFFLGGPHPRPSFDCSCRKPFLATKLFFFVDLWDPQNQFLDRQNWLWDLKFNCWTPKFVFWTQNSIVGSKNWFWLPKSNFGSQKLFLGQTKNH